MFRPYPKSQQIGIEKEKKKSFLKRTAIKKKYKKTGELEMFKQLAKEREMKCENCKVNITEPTVSNFAHVKPKSTHPELRLDKTNVMILCTACRYAHDFQGKKIFNERKK